MALRRYGLMARTGFGHGFALVGFLIVCLVLPVGAQPQPCEPGSGPDFSGRTLSQTDLEGIDDFRCADITGAVFDGLELVQIDMTGAVGPDASFRNVTFRQVDLVEADLRGADFSNTDMRTLDLSGAQLGGAMFDGASMRGATLDGANLSGVDLSGQGLRQAKFVNVLMRDANFTGADLRQSTLNGDFTGSNFADANMVQTKLSDGIFTDANFTGTDLTQTVLIDADLRGAQLQDVDLTQAQMQGADLTDSDLGGASLIQADVEGATLDGVGGVVPLPLIITIAAGVLLVVLVLSAGRRLTGPGSLVFVLVGSAVAVLGLHMAAGGFTNLIIGMLKPLWVVDGGPLAVVGTDLGQFGLMAGVLVAVAGFGIRSVAKRLG